ncbi:MAG: toxin-antitoxin system HicB family antitoxin [Coriobacteriales bacterium]|jgi:hypothetical protein|nr:toxin-antitoxin system HicB family antitoxin [Coriobacteriales bacterium]
MSTLSVRIPNSLHSDAREIAKAEDVSLNQLIATSLAEKVSAIRARNYLEERAKRGSLEDFRRIMSLVPDAEPDPYDKL